MEILVKKDGENVRFELNGVVDEHGAEDIKKQFQALNVSSVKEVVFDFSRVKHIGSAGIGKLLLFYKDMAIRGGSIRIERVSENVYELLKVLKLDTIFPISRG